MVCDDKLDELQDLDEDPDRETFLKIPAFKTESVNNMGIDNDDKINNKPRGIFHTKSNSASTPVFRRVSAFHTYARSLEYGTCEKVI